MKNPTPKKSVTIIVNAHNENLLLHRTLKSINRNIKHAQRNNISVEVIIVADKVDTPTLNYINQRAQTALTEVEFKLEVVEYGDLGLSRNHGIERASGEFIGNIDADDLWSDNWISCAVNLLQSNEKAIVHHAAVLNFGTKNGVWHIKNSTDPSFNSKSVIEDNWWPSCMMTRRETFDVVRYKKTLRMNGFSFEDWLFNCESLSAGFVHLAVPETTLFYRRKQVSMLVEQISGLPFVNPLFTVNGQKEYLKKSIKEDAATPKGESGATGVDDSDQAIASRDGTFARQLVIKAVKRSGKIAIRVGSRYVKPYLDSHHRVKRYVQSIKDATHTLITSPDDGNQIGISEKIPAWLRNQWYEANEIEASLFPTYNRVNTAYNRAMMTLGPEQSAYWDIAEQLGDDIDYVLVLPYLRKAGAYMVGIHYVKAYKELYPDKKVAILTTEDTYPSLPEMVPEGVELIEAPGVFHQLNRELKKRVLAKVFVNLRPSYVHVLHSQEGFQALQRYPKQISFASKIILSTFNYDYTAEGQRMNALLAYGDEILPYVTKIFTDNEWVADDTVSLFGLDESLVRAHAMPIQISDKQSDGINLRPTDGKMRILWAARLAKQKRPDILYEIAKEAHSKNLPYEFVVYGEIYDKVVTVAFLNKLCKLPNVQYRGAFQKGIQALPTGEFEVYLSTSEAEGTPNAILEAQERSLIVVAPNLGGIPEVVKDKQTGMLVEDFSNIDQYIAALDFIYNDTKLASKMADAGKRAIADNRSWHAFVEQVKVDLS